MKILEVLRGMKKNKKEKQPVLYYFLIMTAGLLWDLIIISYDLAMVIVETLLYPLKSYSREIIENMKQRRASRKVNKYQREYKPLEKDKINTNE